MLTSESKDTSSIFKVGFFDEDPGPLSPSPGPDKDLSVNWLVSDEAALRGMCCLELLCAYLLMDEVRTFRIPLHESCDVQFMQPGLCI